MKYVNLNQAASIFPTLLKGTTKIFYAKSTRDLGMGFEFCQKHNLLPNLADLSATHALLGEVAEDRLEVLFSMLQGEAWSPEGEARDLIKSIGVHHTSMSVGDIIQIGEQVFMVDGCGFVDLTTGKAA